MPSPTNVHGVIVVHGVGQQKRGEILSDFTQGLCRAFRDSPSGSSIPSISMDQSNLTSTGNPPTITLLVTPPAPPGKSTPPPILLRCQEAYWNDAFPPPSSKSVYAWGIVVLRKQWVSFFNMLKNQRNKGYGFKKVGGGALSSDERFGDNGIENLPPVGLWKLWDKARELAAWFSWVPMLLAMYVALGTVLVLQSIPFLGILLPFIKPVYDGLQKMNPVIGEGIGDLTRYTSHEIWAANARQRVEGAIIGMLKDPEVSDVSIVAHSMGCIVTYDALEEGGEVDREIQKTARESPKKITFVTLGQGLNRAFCLNPQGMEGTNYRWRQKPLAASVTGKGKFTWLNIFARQDPGAAGTIDENFIKGASLHAQQYQSVRVMNKDSIMGDHSAYWGNIELVMPLIASAATAAPGVYPWPELRIDKAKFERRLRYARCNSQKMLALKTLAWAAVIAAVVWLIVR